ncbi:uncharacterized protein LOC133424210 [Cololabis saira]|uniref:uncharacterized protein LOC133424210 n=1 Tax=Cololabis saira TaxID=129043 RepID=UPI002AD20C88|nr:uncharacterized protein LOC133424210 [Cololabis saira]
MKTCVVLALFLMAGVSLGDIQKRITGGRPCTKAESKHFVFLEIKNPVTGKTFICSGSVVGNGHWILTAKHCDAFGTIGRIFRRFVIKDITLGTETTNNIHKHPTADVMLIKVNTKLTPIPFSSDADCLFISNQLVAKKSVTMLFVARDTKAGPDTVMCADIEVNGCVSASQSPEWCFYGDPVGCQFCGGDSGAGYIYNNALSIVEKGSGTTSGGKKVEFGHTVCDPKMRKWIDDTMKKP